MEVLMKKVLFLSMVLAIVFFSGCATMIHTKQANVSTSSGTAIPVKVLDNGMPVYTGNLPATFPVRSGHAYTVVYTASDGQERIVMIAEKFNGWFIGSILLGFLPAIVDLATGNIMQIEGSTILPIAYSPSIILTDFIANEDNVKIIGNLYKME
jgi:hypothetical protein